MFDRIRLLLPADSQGDLTRAADALGTIVEELTRLRVLHERALSLAARALGMSAEERPPTLATTLDGQTEETHERALALDLLRQTDADYARLEVVAQLEAELRRELTPDEQALVAARFGASDVG